MNKISKTLMKRFKEGFVIPAQPLALDEKRKFMPRNQRALCRYYIDAGAGGIAVAVHSTQFEIRSPDIRLFEPVLSMTAQFIDEYAAARKKEILKIAGVCGKTRQALSEAEFAVNNNYQACLLSLAAMKDESISGMIKHIKEVSRIMPIIGFYLQSSVGGKVLPYEFWRKFFDIENIIAVKIAPFNRYRTFDVVRALCESGREKDVVLYTGNDDNIIADLLTEYRIVSSKGTKRVRIKGGLLGHWCVWTRKAVEQLEEIHKTIANGDSIPGSLLTKGIEVTDANAAFFDTANNFAGCIPGIHEVLRRQGLLKGIWCLNTHEKLSPGQKEEIDRVYKSYPHLNDDDFVRKNIEKWMS
jgi:dihydrodipicolinate synthase/N-acetylneuraminate lyase